MSQASIKHFFAAQKSAATDVVTPKSQLSLPETSSAKPKQVVGARNIAKIHGPSSKRSKVDRQCSDRVYTASTIGDGVDLSRLATTDGRVLLKPFQKNPDIFSPEPQSPSNTNGENHLKRKAKPDVSPAVTLVNEAAAIVSEDLIFASGGGSAKRQLKFGRTPVRDRSKLVDPVSASKELKLDGVATLRMSTNRKLFDEDALVKKSATPLSAEKAARLKEDLKRVGSLKNLKAKLAQFSGEVSKLDERSRNAEFNPELPNEEPQPGPGPSEPAAPKPAKEKKNGKKLDLKDRKLELQQLKERLGQYSSKVTAALEQRDERKTAVTKAAAYIRLKHLAIPPSLHLPPDHSLLLEKFKTADSLVAMMYNRSDIVTASRLMLSVKGAIRKNFTEHNIGQIRTVYPEAYFYEQRKIARFGEKRETSSSYQLVITPNLESDLIGYREPPTTPSKIGVDASSDGSALQQPPTPGTPSKGTPTKSDSTPTKVPDPTASPRKDGAKSLTPGQLTMRKEVFHWRLMELVKDEHEKFLRSLPSPVSLDRAQLMRWHPNFRLDKVDPVPAADLPRPPYVPVLKSAKDAFEKIKNEEVPLTITLALERHSLRVDATKSPATPSPSSLKRVDSSLLERIRSKEASSASKSMSTNPEEVARQRRLKILPSVCRTVHSFFMLENYKPVGEDKLIAKIVSGHQVAASEARKSLDLLRDVTTKAKPWMGSTKHPTSGVVYYKVQRGVPIRQLMGMIPST